MKLITILFTLFYLNNVHGQELSNDNQAIVKKFISYIRTEDKAKIADIITYPFAREYPLPLISNKQEFINKYNEIFDDSLKQMIINSNPSTDWFDMGWRGIMLNNGQLWLDFDGRLMRINYLTKVEFQTINLIIENDKNMIHESIKQYKNPISIIQTSKFRIRIDELDNGYYRYASWSITRLMKDKPDLILVNGELVAEGSGGNHSYRFKNNDYIYECSFIVIGEEDSPPARLIIYKGDKEILKQVAQIIK